MRILSVLSTKISSGLQLLIKVVSDFLFSVSDLVFASIPGLIRASIILNAKLNDKLNSAISNNDPRLKIQEQELNMHLTSDLNRLERIEDKAKSTVIGVALSISLASPGILLLVQTDVFADESYFLRLISAIILTISILFLLISSYLSLSAYKVGRIFLPQLENHSKLVKPKEARKIIIRCIELNQIRVIQNANLLSASMDCLRNGLILALIFLILAISSALF